MHGDTANMVSSLFAYPVGIDFSPCHHFQPFVCPKCLCDEGLYGLVDPAQHAGLVGEILLAVAAAAAAVQQLRAP
jgi:hypothetical protein